MVPGHNGRTDPIEDFIPSHHFTAAWNSAGSRCKPNLTEGMTESHDLARGAEAERSLALLAGEEVINID